MEIQMKLVIAAMFSALLIKFCEAGEDLRQCYRCISTETQSNPWCKGGAKDMKDKNINYIEANCESQDDYCMLWVKEDGTVIRGCSKGKDMAYNEEPCQANAKANTPIKEKEAITLKTNPLDKVYCCDADSCNGGVSFTRNVVLTTVVAIVAGLRLFE